MKLIFLTLIVVVYLMDATTEAQRRPGCIGPNPANCTLARNVGIGCPTAPGRRMWYYDINSRDCRNLAYLGCGGNANRFCTRKECRRTCARRRP